MKYPSKKVINRMIIVACAILLGVGVFYGTYYFFINKSYSSYQDKVKVEINNINKANEASSKFTKGATIDSEKILKEMSDSISAIQTSQSKIKNLVIADKYNNDHNNLILGLDNNILIYKEILNIVRNPKNEKLSDSIPKLQKYRDDCLNYYAIISKKALNIDLPKETIELINNTVSFTQKQIRENLDAQVLMSQNEDFLSSLEANLNKFNEVRKDYMPSVQKARTTVNGYEELLKNLNSVENVLKEIKASITDLSVPKNALPLYKALAQTLSDYDIYIQNLKYAVKTEQLTSVAGVPSSESTNSLYQPSKDQLKVSEESYKSFVKLHNEFKNSLNKY